ncbi:MAG: serine hydrolase [Flavisolibacter sp.]
MEIKTHSVMTHDPLLSKLLNQHPEHFDTIVRNQDKWPIKIVYTQIDRNANNDPVFTNHYYNVNANAYFYPASTVKMPVAFLALQKLNELKIPGLDMYSSMITEAAYSNHTPVYNDPNTEDGRPTIANYIKKIFLVSDNDAYNRLYEFLGQEYINKSLHKMGYDRAQIVHRLDIFLSEEENRHTNAVKFMDTSARIVYEKPMVRSQLVYQPRKTFLGKSHYSKGELVNQPFDFSKKNRMLLTDLHSILQTVIFPEAVKPAQRFRLSGKDYKFLYKYMSMKPGESSYPYYDSNYNGNYAKFLLYGGKSEPQSGIRIFNKVGDAYGFLTDVAYVVDFENKVEFFLSANISCNSDGIFNDDNYDYENTGFPFLKNLGHVIYQYELQRKKKNLPDLGKFQMNYGQ